MGRAYRADRAQAPGHGRARLPPVRATRASRPTFRTGRVFPIGMNDYEGRPLLGGPSTARRSRARRCRSSTTSTGSRPSSRGRSGRLPAAASSRRRSPSTRLTQARFYRHAMLMAALPADRQGAPALPRPRRAGPRPLAVRPALRRRHAEGELRRRPRDRDLVAPCARREPLHARPPPRARAGARAAAAAAAARPPPPPPEPPPPEPPPPPVEPPPPRRLSRHRRSSRLRPAVGRHRRRLRRRLPG